MKKNVFLIALISFSGIFNAFIKKSELESDMKNHAKRQLRSEKNQKSSKIIVDNKLESDSRFDKHKPLNFNSERRRRENDNMDSNPMLLLDASNGFQRAIQRDIDELNNPSIPEKVRKSEINSLNDSMAHSVFPDSSSKQGYRPLEDSTTKHEEPGLNDAFGLLSETAQHYSEFIIEEMRYMAEIQKEKHQSSCDYSIDPKCSESNSTSEPSFSNNNETSTSNKSYNLPQKYGIDTNLNQTDYDKECDAWSDWTECSKPCDTGVTIRTRNCTLADSTIKTFYEHHSCNTQACVKSTLPGIIKGDTNMDILPKSNDFHSEEDEGCISAHINFQKYQYNVYTIFDDTDEHNDVEYKNMISLDIQKSPMEAPISFKEAQFQGFGNDANYTSSLSAVIDEIYVYKCALSQSQIINTANTCKMRESTRENCPSPMHGLCPSQPKNDFSSEANNYVSPQIDHTPLNT
ncbi:hypothetical protein MXB_5491 [Myxobolus squamalis]|nr:hypothetical protein MXB_5491 [Myxobolus squamalis]